MTSIAGETAAVQVGGSASTRADMDKVQSYRDLMQMIAAITAGESDAVANMANTAALLWEYLPDTSWVGFYRVIAGELVLGPFQGKAACVRIAWGTGVCGTAAATGTTQSVNNVHDFAGHIACDPASAAELVVPIMVAGRVVAVLDIDSPTPARFADQDRQGIEAIAGLLGTRLA